MMRSCLPALLCVLAVSLPSSLRAVGSEAMLANEVVPRTVRVSFAADQVFVSIRSRVQPIALGDRTWARWDRDGDGLIGAQEAGPLKAEIKRLETGHLGVSVDGTVVPMRDLALRIEQPLEGPYPLDAELVVRIEGKLGVPLAAGRHRFTLYDQPRGKDGIVPFRVGFARGLKVLGGGGARGEIRGQGKRLEVVATKLAPIFWGTFERLDEGAAPSSPPTPAAP
jgi:hypothetical protein